MWNTVLHSDKQCLLQCFQGKDETIPNGPIVEKVGATGEAALEDGSIPWPKGYV
uniref:Uncharacterized protein n=1 Tax=Arundo donax TaxID=35708 RepID=A0A0A9BH22_ARUDO